MTKWNYQKRRELELMWNAEIDALTISKHFECTKLAVWIQVSTLRNEGKRMKHRRVAAKTGGKE